MGALVREGVPARVFGPRRDRFSLGALICKGGQGKVYECTRVGEKGSPSCRVFAAKIIDLHSCTAARDMKNLRREIRTLQELHHPRIVNLHEAFWEEDECIIVMDKAAGGDLHSKIAREVVAAPPPFPGLGGSEMATSYVARQLFDGLGYMHANDIIHRDLKLENILIAESRQSPKGELLEVKIADFGLSKCMETENPHRRSRRMTVVGTPNYLAPEVLMRTYDERADLWSLGVMLYVMLCGEFPFAIDPRDAMFNHDKYFEAISCVSQTDSWSSASEEAHDIVRALLRKEPSQRLGLSDCASHPWLVAVDPAFQAVLASCSPAPAAQQLEQHKRGPMTGAFRRVASICGAIDGAVRRVACSTGAAVDSVELQLRSGCCERHGAQGGDARVGYDLGRSERIVAVMQEERGAYLGNALVMYTSEGRVLGMEGWDAHRWSRFVAPADSHIVGLQFDGGALTGVHLAPASALGPVAQIGGRVGHAVDSVDFELRDGATRSYGTSSGGDAVCPFRLQPSELIIVVEVCRRDAFLGSSIAFYTSLGNVFALNGLESCPVSRFAASERAQVCGLSFDGSRLTQVSTCSITGIVEHVQTVRT